MIRRSTALFLALLAFAPAGPASAGNAKEYDTKPITNPAVIARMRQEGRLPDSYTKRNCRYDLAGDPGAAYYHVTCR
ncbi:hypothetical protein ACRAWG_29365 [Methylobacterium sp. P31]